MTSINYVHLEPDVGHGMRMTIRYINTDGVENGILASAVPGVTIAINKLKASRNRTEGIIDHPRV